MPEGLGAGNVILCVRSDCLMLDLEPWSVAPVYCLFPNRLGFG